MTISDRGASSRHHTPASIRDESFQRRLRGLDAGEVYRYLDQLADQVQATERELGDTRAENERLQLELRRVQSELDEYEQVGERVNEQVVQLFSQAQLIAEEMVEDVSRDARERVGQARAQEREIVQGAVSVAGEHVRSYARSAQAQMQAIMESFAHDVERLGSPPLSGDAAPAAPQPKDPLFDDFGDRQFRFRNGSRPDTPGSD